MPKCLPHTNTCLSSCQDTLSLSGSAGVMIDSLGIPNSNIQLTLDASLAIKYADAITNHGCVAARLSQALADAIGCEDFCRYDTGIYERDVGYTVTFGTLFEKEGSLLEGGAVKDAPATCAAPISPCGATGGNTSETAGGTTGAVGGGTTSGTTGTVDGGVSGGSDAISTFPANPSQPPSPSPSSKPSCGLTQISEACPPCLPDACRLSAAGSHLVATGKIHCPLPCAVVYAPAVSNDRGMKDCRLTCSQQGLLAIDDGNSTVSPSLCRVAGGIKTFFGRRASGPCNPVLLQHARSHAAVCA